MLVVHPKDRTTSVLSTLYKGMDANVVSGKCSNKEMEHLLHHVSTQERIMLLGHGSDKGLFYREDDTKDEFDKIIVGHPHAFQVIWLAYGVMLISLQEQKVCMDFSLA